MADSSAAAALPPQSDPDPSPAAAAEVTKDVEMATEDKSAQDQPAPSEPAPTDDPKQSEDVADASAGPTTNGSSSIVPTSSKKSSAKRKSTSGTPAKKLNRKKSMPDLHLNVQPGEYWYVQMKGYPPWPAIICDEDMLPPSLLSKRPVSAMRVDGTYREDFEEGGKNARDRRYPVMFLGTNEFAWQVNTELAPLDMDEIKGMVERNEMGKKSKALWTAYQVAAEEQNLEFFKDMLEEHERGRQEEERRRMDIEEAKAAKKEEKAKKALDDDGDIDMEDAETTEKKKASKKRKKSTAEAEAEEPKKTSTKIVIKGLKSAAAEEPAPKAKKARKSKGPEPETVAPVQTSTPVESDEDRHKRRLRTVMFLRHKLQKGLISRSEPVLPEHMDDMDKHLTDLERFQDLETEIIRESKVNKLLKVILKLKVIPRDEEFKFKERCTKLLAAWNALLAVDEPNGTPAPPPNGVNDKGESTPAETKPEEEKEEPVANGKGEGAKSVEPEVSAAAESPETKMEVEATT